MTPPRPSLSSLSGPGSSSGRPSPSPKAGASGGAAYRAASGRVLRRTPRSRFRVRPRNVPPYWRLVDDGEKRSTLPPWPVVDLWVTALASRGIAYRLAGRNNRLRLYVPPLLEQQARTELAALHAENSKPRPVFIEPPTHANAHWVLAILLVLILWHGIRMHWGFLPSLPGVPRLSPETWASRGELDVFRVRAYGEWFRCTTALTLHADSLHLFGNVLFGAPFLILLCRRVGLGLGLFLILIAGSLGNAFNALYRPAGHISLGFSTALFGTVGVLSGFMALQGWGSRHDAGKNIWRRGILLLAAGTGILAMLGTEGEKTDYAAHLFGLLAGFLVGGTASAITRRTGQPSRRTNTVLGLAATTLLVLCWRLAL